MYIKVQRWEYAYETSSEPAKTNELLKDRGNNGWELVSVVPMSQVTFGGMANIKELAFFFRRPRGTPVDIEEI